MLNQALSTFGFLDFAAQNFFENFVIWPRNITDVQGGSIWPEAPWQKLRLTEAGPYNILHLHLIRLKAGRRIVQMQHLHFLYRLWYLSAVGCGAVWSKIRWLERWITHLMIFS